MKGRKQQFTAGELSFTLARPAFSEMANVAGRIQNLDTTEGIANILLEAVTESDHAQLETFLDDADHETAMQLWSEYLDFAGYEDFLDAWQRPKIQRETKQQAMMFRAMKDEGLLTESFLEDFIAGETTSSANSTKDT